MKMNGHCSGFAILVLFIVVVLSIFNWQTVADQTTTLSPNPYGQTIVVANLSVPKGAEIAYSFTASAVVQYSITGYANYGGFPPLHMFLSGTNSSASDVFVAPFEEYIYRLGFVNPSNSTSVQITFDFHEIEHNDSTGDLLVPLIAVAVIVNAVIVLAVKSRGRGKSR